MQSAAVVGSGLSMVDLDFIAAECQPNTIARPLQAIDEDHC